MVASRLHNALAVLSLVACARLVEAAHIHGQGHRDLTAKGHSQRRPHLLRDVWKAVFQPMHFDSWGSSSTNASGHEAGILTSWLHSGGSNRSGDCPTCEQSQNTTEWGEFLRRLRFTPFQQKPVEDTAQVELEPPICMGRRAVPQLYLLGAQKAGTTTMAADFIAAGIKSAIGEVKELHTFDDYCGFHKDRYRNESEWVGDVKAGFCTRLIKDKLEWMQNFNRNCNETTAALIDMTPLNLRLPHLPSTLRTWYGEDHTRIGFIVALREPLRRLHSGFYHARTFGMQRYANFSDYVSMVIKRAPALLDTNFSGFARDYPLDEFYRSMYARNLFPWLRNFEPRQFAVVPMKSYFLSIENRRNAIAAIRKQFGVAAFEEQIVGTSQMNKRQHIALTEDLGAAQSSILQQRFFEGDTNRLVTLLAKSIPQGLNLVGYTGGTNETSVKEFLVANW